MGDTLLSTDISPLLTFTHRRGFGPTLNASWVIDLLRKCCMESAGIRSEGGLGSASDVVRSMVVLRSTSARSVVGVAIVRAEHPSFTLLELLIADSSRGGMGRLLVGHLLQVCAASKKELLLVAPSFDGFVVGPHKLAVRLWYDSIGFREFPHAEETLGPYRDEIEWDRTSEVPLIHRDLSCLDLSVGQRDILSLRDKVHLELLSRAFHVGSHVLGVTRILHT